MSVFCRVCLAEFGLRTNCMFLNLREVSAIVIVGHCRSYSSVQQVVPAHCGELFHRRLYCVTSPISSNALYMK